MFRKKFYRTRIGKRKYYNHFNSKRFFSFKIIFLLIIIFIFIPCGMVFGWFYFTIYKDLPDISKIDRIEFSQTTTITDKNNIVLYKLFDENRTYVTYDKISNNLINAIISTEDKNFWTNPGIDLIGIIRAGVNDVLKMEKQQGASTITQQLIKDIYLSREKTVTRKLKEISLAVKLNEYIKSQIKIKYKYIQVDELDKKVKQIILEKYLNHIFLGNNAYGIEAASKMYFGTSAQNLDILQSAILSSIPKAPTKYNPYTNKESILGDFKIFLSGEDTIFSSGNDSKKNVNKLIVDEVTNIINSNSFLPGTDSQDTINKILKSCVFDINYSGNKYDIEYLIGRKDYILARMLEDNYISQQQFKESFIKSINYNFNYNRIEIKAPHFVFWIIESLKDQYGEDLIMKGGLIIKTSLDYNIQQIAENSIKANMPYVKSKGGNNSAFIYVDSKNGDILSYVGSSDFSNEEIDGQVDILQASRQPGSTIKPLLYALGFKNLPISIDNLIFDSPLKLGKDSPDNVDGQFQGPIPIKKALAGSRNIPAIKMYFAVGEERIFKTFLKSIGMLSLSEKINYGYPMAIGGAEIKPIELLNGYMHLSASGQPAKLDPILEIKTGDGSIIYKKNIVKQEQVIPAGVAYLLWKILSDKNNLPSTWINEFKFNGLKFGTKSGTTNIKLSNGKKLPRDGLFVAYTPSKVSVFWAGNTKGEPMNIDAYGGWLNSKVWKNFYSELLNKGLITDEDMEPTEIKKIFISKITGKLISSTTPSELIVDSIAYINNIPNKIDQSKIIKIDSYCSGVVSEYTPLTDIQDAYYIDTDINLKGTKDEDYINNYFTSKLDSNILSIINKPIFFSNPTQICPKDNRKYVGVNDLIRIEVITPIESQKIAKTFSVLFKIESQTKISQVSFFVNNIFIKSFDYENKLSIMDLKTIKMGNIKNGDNILKIKVKDIDGNENSLIRKIEFIEKDEKIPYIKQDNIKIFQENGVYNVSLFFEDDESAVKSVIIYQNGQVLRESDVGVLNFTVIDSNNITYQVEDVYGNIGKGNLTVN